jgi:cellulose biosynthesis protein BcsQ
MLRLALLASNPAAAGAIELMAQEMGVFEVVHRGSPAAARKEARALSIANPDVILLDTGDWQSVSELAGKLSRASRRGVLIAFRPQWTEEEQKSFMEAGIDELLPDPFSPQELEKAVHRAFHRKYPLTHQNIVAFLPSKAGSGCSTVALNTAGTLANELNKRTLLVEADRRSGVLSVLLDVEGKGGLAKVLAISGALTGVEWRQHLVSIGKLDLLLADPFNPGPMPSWINYYQLLSFVERDYDFIVVDLPEVPNPATAEVLNAARSVFIVCEPEVTSLKLVPLRRSEVESYGVPKDKIFVLGNRWESRRLKRADVVRTAQAPMYAALPNDYVQVKNAALESRLVARDSPFGSACAELARRLANMPAAQPSGPVAGLLRKLMKT